MTAYAFHVMKEEDKELRIINRLSKDDLYPIVEIDGKWKPFIRQEHMKPKVKSYKGRDQNPT